MRSAVTVLMYHRVLEDAECADYPFPSLVMPRSLFEAQLAYLSDLPQGIGGEQDPARYRLRQRDDGAYFGFAAPAQSSKPGFFPAEAPELSLVVMIDEPGKSEHFGGEVAAPVFSTVMTGAMRLLDVPPDQVRDGRLVFDTKTPKQRDEKV